MFILQIILSRRRNKAPNLTEIRKLAFEDLDECMYEILKDTLAYLEENPEDVDSATKDAFAYYKDLHTEQAGKTRISGLTGKETMIYEQRTGNGKALPARALDDKKAHGHKSN